MKEIQNIQLIIVGNTEKIIKAKIENMQENIIKLYARMILIGYLQYE